jgi:hypothetical protein
MGLGPDSMADSCTNDSKPLGSTEDREFLDWLSFTRKTLLHVVRYYYMLACHVIAS